MKINKIILGFSFIAVSAIFVISCKKPTANVAPEPDMDFESSREAVWATYVVTDIEQIAAFVGENQFLTNFYINKPGTGNPITGGGSITVTRDTFAKISNYGFRETQCLDGKRRDGTLFLRYFFDQDYQNGNLPVGGPNPTQDPKARFYHDFGFCGRVTLSSYKVDGWDVVTWDGTAEGSPAVIYAKMQKADFEPKTVQLSWTFEGGFKFKPDSANTAKGKKEIVWMGKFTKTLLNSTVTSVWKADKLHKQDGAITWSLGIVSYTGSAKGKIGDSPFSLEFTKKPLIRDFTCSSDPIYDVAPNTTTVTNAPPIKPLYSSHHPFVRGIMSFTPGAGTANEKYPRQIYFGEEGTNINYDPNNIAPNSSTVVPAAPKAPCDNSGEVIIKGISYRIDFLK